MFTKFNTDEVGELRSLLEISAMPTFKVFRAKAEVACQRGWSESHAVSKRAVRQSRTRCAPITGATTHLRRRAAHTGAHERTPRLPRVYAPGPDVPCDLRATTCRAVAPQDRGPGVTRTPRRQEGARRSACTGRVLCACTVHVHCTSTCAFCRAHRLDEEPRSTEGRASRVAGVFRS